MSKYLSRRYPDSRRQTTDGRQQTADNRRQTADGRPSPVQSNCCRSGLNSTRRTRPQGSPYQYLDWTYTMHTVPISTCHYTTNVPASASLLSISHTPDTRTHSNRTTAHRTAPLAPFCACIAPAAWDGMGWATPPSQRIAWWQG